MNNSLMHHGIKGQKHGVRRYQNADGTLTTAGKARYDTGSGGRGVGHLVSVGSNNGHAGAPGVLSAAPNVKSNSSAGQGILQRMKTNHLVNKYARASYRRSQALRGYDKYGGTFGLKRAERQMQTAGRNLTGAQKAGGIARMHRNIARGYNVGSVASALAGGVVAVNPVAAAFGAPFIGTALGLSVAGVIANRREARRHMKNAKIAQDYANEHKNDDSDYLPERVRDVENRLYRPTSRRRVVHSGMSAAHIDINQFKSEQVADAVSIALSSAIS